MAGEPPTSPRCPACGGPTLLRNLFAYLALEVAARSLLKFDLSNPDERLAGLKLIEEALSRVDYGQHDERQDN